MRKATFVIAVLLFVSSMTFGQSMGGIELYGNLVKYEILRRGNGNIENLFEAGTALGYVLGIFDSLEENPDSINLFDPPPNVTAGQIMGVVFKYFEEHPEERHERANILVNRALLEAWPKKKEVIGRRFSYLLIGPAFSSKPN